MPNTPANDMMEYQDMVNMQQRKRNSRLYAKTDSDSADKISTLIDTTANELSKMVLSDKISLKNVETVRRKSEEYIKACQDTGTLPSKIGLSRAFGISRQAIEDFMKRNPTHATS